MFGGLLPQPKVPKCPPKKHPTPDILNPSQVPGIYGYRARASNTDYHIKSLHYKQRFDAMDSEKYAKDYIKEGVNLKMIDFEVGAQKKVLKSEIEARVRVKLEQHEAEVNVRREKLKELFATEEREFVKITVENCQKGVQDKLEAMKEKARLLKERRSKEEEEFVQKKRLQQYMSRCMDLIPAMNEKNLKESKIIQLQQMRENEARREVERELNRMWADLQQKEINAKAEREKQELIVRYNRDKKDRDILELQIEGKRLLKEEEKRITEEDRIVLEKIADKMRQEITDAQSDSRKKRDQICSDLLQQITIQRSFMEKRRQEEDALDNALAKCARAEYERELNQAQSNTETARRETDQHRKHLKELARLNKEEQGKLDQLLYEYQCEINKKMDKVQCELQEARERLLQQTLKERDQQLEHKKHLAQKLLEMKQTENEWLTNVISTNERLLVETKRLSQIAVKQYRDDLNKQIEYNNVLKERENAEMARQLEKGKEEELKYQSMVQHLIGLGHSAGSVNHPFRRILSQRECHCEPLMPKY